MDPETVMVAIRSLDEKFDFVNNKLDAIQSTHHEFVTSITRFLKESYDSYIDDLIDDSISVTVNPAQVDESTSKNTSKSNLMLSNMTKMIRRWQKTVTSENENHENEEAQTRNREIRNNDSTRNTSSTTLLEPSTSAGKIDDHIVSNNCVPVSPTAYTYCPEYVPPELPSFMVKYDYMKPVLDENGQKIHYPHILVSDIENGTLEDYLSNRVKYNEDDMSITMHIEKHEDDIFSDDCPLQKTVIPIPIEERQISVIENMDVNLSEEIATNTTNISTTFIKPNTSTGEPDDHIISDELVPLPQNIEPLTTLIEPNPPTVNIDDPFISDELVPIPQTKKTKYKRKYLMQYLTLVPKIIIKRCDADIVNNKKKIFQDMKSKVLGKTISMNENINIEIRTGARIERKSLNKTKDQKSLSKDTKVTQSKKRSISSHSRHKLIKRIKNLPLVDTPAVISFENGSIPVTPTSSDVMIPAIPSSSKVMLPVTPSSSNVLIKNKTPRTSSCGRVLRLPFKLMGYHIKY